MMYLIFKLFFYLVVALLLGGGAGWMLRQLTAAKREEQLQRELTDTRTKVPQLESMVRARDEQLRKLKQLQSGDDPASEAARAEVEELRVTLRERDNEVKRLKGEVAEAREAAASGLIAGDALLDSEVSAEERDDADELIAALHQQIASLKEELAGQQIKFEMQAGDQTQARENAELAERLRQRAEDQRRLQGQLEQQQRRVLELERERELQAKSLRVLHQQLELARDSSIAEANR